MDTKNVKLELFCQISGENPVFVVGLAEDELDGCGQGSGFPDIPVWFGFWIALARGVQYAVDQIELQEELWEFFGDGGEGMNKWIECSDRYPEMGVDVLLFWEHSRHIENGKFFQDRSIYHVLFDGESMNDQPSHWMNRPDDPEGS